MRASASASVITIKATDSNNPTTQNSDASFELNIDTSTIDLCDSITLTSPASPISTVLIELSESAGNPTSLQVPEISGFDQ